jgi:hypothetical protein
MITPNSIDSLTTPEIPSGAVATPKRGSNSPLATKAEPHPLALTLDGLKLSAATLRQELSNQSVRLADLARLTEEKAVLVESIDSEVISYVEGSASLAVLDQNLGVLGWTTNKRGVAAVLEFHNLRQCALDLKMSVIEAIDAASSAVVAKRQREVVCLIAGWDGTTPAPSPLAVSLIAAACPTVRKLEALRITLEAVKMDLGLATLATTLEPILDLLAGIPVPPARPALWGGHTSRGLTAVMGWNGSDPWLETLAVFDRTSDANNFYNEFRGKSGYCGYKQVVLLDEAHPSHSRRFESEYYIGQDLMQNAEIVRVHPHTDGTTPRLFDDAKAWLAV